MKVFITGRPGTGKTTLIKELSQRIGEKAGGFYTEEIRKGGKRTGFKITTLKGDAGLLSGVDIDSPHRIGKYKVDMVSFERIALPAIERALADSKIVIIDEIGPMELFSGKFKKLLLRALDSQNDVIATIKLKGSAFIDKIRLRSDVTIFNLASAKKEEIICNILSGVDARCAHKKRKKGGINHDCGS